MARRDERARYSGGKNAPACVPRREDFVDRAATAEAARRIDEGAPVPLMITDVSARDFGDDAALVLTGVLPGGRQAVAVLQHRPWFDVVGLPGQTHDELEALVRERETAMRARDEIGYGRQGSTKLAVGLVKAVRHRAAPWKGGMFYAEKPAVLRFFYRNYTSYDSAVRSARKFGLTLRWDATKNGENIKMLRYLALKTGVWSALRRCAENPPTCRRCRPKLNEWDDCECGHEGCEACGKALYWWSRMSCACPQFPRTVYARYDHGRGTTLLTGQLLPDDYFSTSTADVRAAASVAEMGEATAEWGAPWGDQDALDRTPLFEVTYDLETCWRPAHHNGGPPIPGDPNTHMIIAAFVLSRSDSADPLAAVVVVDSAPWGPADMDAAIGRGEYDDEIAYSFGEPPAKKGARRRRREMREIVAANCPCGWTVVQVKRNSARDFSLAMAAVLRAFQPDVLMGYNSHNYDEPFWKGEAERSFNEGEARQFFECLAPFSVGKDPFKWNWRTGDVKISDGFEKRSRFDGVGFVSVDVLLQIKRIHKEGVPDASRGGKPSYTLSSMLQYYGLQDKIASDFAAMDRAWLARDNVRLSWDALYCVFDAVGTMRLAHEASVVTSRVMLGAYGHCTLEHAFERGDGMRIEGAFTAEAARRDYLVTYCKNTDAGSKIEGAWVMAPWPGPQNNVLVSFDVNSQYPSVAKALNLSPESVTYDEAEARAAGARLGLPVRQIHATFAHGAAPPISGWVVGHGGSVELYATIPTVFEFLGIERSKFKKVRDLIGSALSVFRSAEPSVAGMRAAMQKLYAKVGPGWGFEPISGAEPGADVPASPFYARLTDRFIRKYAVADKRQLAVKVNSNTGFGRLAQIEGSSKDMYDALIAGAITFYSREVIRIAVAVALAFDPRITHEYTDTDSLYVNVVALLPEPLRSRFLESRGDTMRAAVLEARRALEPRMFELQRQMNAALAEQIGPEVTLKYEGMHMKSLMQRAKCYESLLLKTEAEQPSPALRVSARTLTKDLNICGSDVIKRSCSPMLKQYIVWVLMRVFDLDQLWPSEDDFRAMLRRIIDDFTGVRALDGGAGAPLDPELVADSGIWRKAKSQVSVAVFMARMAERYAKYSLMDSPPVPPGLFAPPTSGVRFRYVIVGSETSIAVNGRVVKHNVGSRMEYLHTYNWVRDHPECGLTMKLDYAYYAEKGLASKIGAIFAFLPEFFSPPLRARWRAGERNEAIAESARNAAAWIMEEIDLVHGNRKTSHFRAKQLYRAALAAYQGGDRASGMIRGKLMNAAHHLPGEAFEAAVTANSDRGVWLQGLADVWLTPLVAAAPTEADLKRRGRKLKITPESIALASPRRRGSAGAALLAALNAQEYARRESMLASYDAAQAASAAIAKEFLANLAAAGEGASFHEDAAAREAFKAVERSSLLYLAAARARVRVGQLYDAAAAAGRRRRGLDSAELDSFAGLAGEPPVA